MTKKFKATVLVTFLLVILIVIAMSAVTFRMHHKVLPPKATPVVSASPVTLQTWQIYVQGVGTLKANQGIMMKSEVDGRITQVNFESGQTVTSEDIILELYNEPQKGQLKYAKAQYELSQLKYERDEKLYKKEAVSKEELDEAKADMEAKLGSLQEAQGNYDQTIIKAPFDGRLGLRNVSVGDYVEAGDDIVYLQNVNPLYVDFSIPEKYLMLLNKGDKVIVKPNAMPEKTLNGVVHSFETVIDSDTGMIGVRSLVPNEEGKLLPGGYVEITLYFGEEEQVLTVPQSSIIYDAAGNYVYIVESNKAKKQIVEIGKQINDNIMITSGLKEGQSVIYAGVNKVHDGSDINIAH